MKKPSELPKDKRDSVRINKEIDRALRERGLSVQKVLDNALDRLFDATILVVDVKEKK